MKYFALQLDGLNQNVTNLLTNDVIDFECTSQQNGDIFSEVSLNDRIVGCFGSETIETNIVFDVLNIDNNKLSLRKTLETHNKATVDTNISNTLKENIICELAESEYHDIINRMLSSYVDSSSIEIAEAEEKNIIYYGVPGCGKSFKVEKKLQDMRVDTEDIFRTTFYLDYSNTDFIGQIYPTIDGDNVEYKPIPGPFTKALERALRYKEKTVYLVIEEINRGNAAAIFGDLFQLLDRLKKDYDGRIVGDSEYPISNEFIEGYFIKQNEIYKAAGEPEIEFKRGNIYIPHNLVIYATMNTSDQNVFPLDTAFKRRWQRERVLSDWTKSNAGYNIPGSKYTWYEFAEGINELIRKHSSDGSMTEDKCLGSFFATPNMLLIGTETSVEAKKQKLKAFVNNVVDYLYNDVTKFDHKLLFVNTVENYEKMYNEFDSYDFSSELDLSRWFNKEVIDSIDSKKR